MLRFSANLGFLWQELPLPDAIRAAKAAGFDAVECHWPYEYDPEEVAMALKETGLHMLSLNTRRGDVEKGDNGLAAIPGRETEAREAIDEAIAYAMRIGTYKIHIMAGMAEGETAQRTFVKNLEYACAQGKKYKRTMLIEPLNRYDAPGYFLQTTGQAMEMINQVSASNLKLMFDCYHVYLMEGNLEARIKEHLPSIGHIQFAGVPGRGAPDTGEINYTQVFKWLKDLGYNAPLGAEYEPGGPTEKTLGWMQR